MRIDVREYPTEYMYEDGTWFCNHADSNVETITHDGLSFQGHYQWEERIYVCTECEQELEGDPDADKAEYLAEMDYDNYMDNREY